MRCGGPGRERGPGRCFWLWLWRRVGAGCGGLTVEKRLYRSRGLCCGRACGGSFKGWGASCWQAGLLRSVVGCGGLAAQGPAAPGLLWVWGGSRGVQLLRAMQCLLQAVSSHLGLLSAGPWALCGVSWGSVVKISFAHLSFCVSCSLCFAICLSFSVSTWLSRWVGQHPGGSVPAWSWVCGLDCAGKISRHESGHSERTFIKAGDVHQRKGLGQKQQD